MATVGFLQRDISSRLRGQATESAKTYTVGIETLEIISRKRIFIESDHV